jgi:hypothetical protein
LANKSEKVTKYSGVGSRVYIGRQGKGKTLSMVNYAYAIKQAYPNCGKFSSSAPNLRQT